MGRKIFVSYKHGDTLVQNLGGQQTTKVRDYVNLLEEMLDVEDHIYMGEADNESLAGFKNETIESKLRDKIYNSSITIVMISKGMREVHVVEADQWIPWEISYSLRESSRNDRTHKSNGILAVVVPDENGSYEYYIEDHSCAYCDCRRLRNDRLFKILGMNMFNVKNPTYSDCEHHTILDRPYLGEPCYIPSVKWPDFRDQVNHYLDLVAGLRDRIEDYNVIKQV